MMRTLAWMTVIGGGLWALSCAEISVPANDQACAVGATHCADDTTVETCNDSGTGFVFLQDCGHNQRCDGGACVEAPGSGPGGGGGGECGPLTNHGCCNALNLLYCEGGAVQSVQCDTGCGWNPDTTRYDCGQHGADPTGKNPKTCP